MKEILEFLKIFIDIEKAAPALEGSELMKILR